MPNPLILAPRPPEFHTFLDDGRGGGWHQAYFYFSTILYYSISTVQYYKIIIESRWFSLGPTKIPNLSAGPCGQLLE